MANGVRAIQFATREDNREHQFKQVWVEELDDVFSDVAPYYDRANHVASLGLWNYFRYRFLSTIDVQSGQKVLDVCAGTNAIGIALLKKQPDLQVHAIDRSKAMQAVGHESACKLGMHIDSTIGDVHTLPFPDNHFDVVTLQYASRHLRIMDVCREIRRVLKPGGHFYHCDMLRPANKFVEWSYYAYLRFCLNFTALLFRSSTSTRGCKQYFINALRMFYSADEFSDLLRDVEFEEVSSQTLLGGMIGYHTAMKPIDT
ncbi:MAG: bifunctional demethylmenaquinone methyltransferase/2-methoxy-6-polyprenyl-1,4-benzoquinol methylase UbiE [Gammaproteobacteria bacterium]|nr:MAG: bifunctional demethylmenaquinone methyltransferase/2-methoxy-6-polyprenyl-1,4-benzoquinol methylase UbiE [Gammaproteobacteria bacterium]